MNVFITGGTGYLGSALISRLIKEKNVKVFALVRDREKVRELGAKINFPQKLVYIYGDLRDHVYDFGNIDAVVHLASEHNPFDCEDKSGFVIDNNVGGTFRIVQAAHKFNVPYFIFASAFGIYGPQSTMPLKEDLIPKPVTPKFLITYVNEVITKNLAGSNTKYANLRLVHMFGVGTLPSRIKVEFTNKFARSVCQGEKLTLYGDGNQSVDLVHVRDVCDCVYKLLTAPDSAWNESYNVGGGRAVSMNELAAIYKESATELGLKEPEISYIDTQNYIDSKGLSSVWLDITKVKTKVGWYPSISVKEGVKELINAYLT
ncbi:NAD(P)-dependent oxidoreductase [candidate division KSB1 bacterium]|nr:NAD(P)-dependent oxidoreductase [candidate division KSB1 bacterium]